jgi:hypothetical protein
VRPDAAQAVGNSRNRLFCRWIRTGMWVPATPYKILIPPPVLGKATLTILAFDSADRARLLGRSETKI